MLRIVTAGPAVSVQDGGRTGRMRFGVTAAGPMDPLAHATANLAIGAHTIIISTQDAAGNVATLTRNVSVAALAAFQLAAVAPGNGETDVGVTFRPRIDFTRAVNPATPIAV